MTLHDDSDLELLERELTALAEPRDEDERLHDVVRAQLAAGLGAGPHPRPHPRRPHPRPLSRARARRRRPMRVALGMTAVTAAAAAIALVALGGTAGSGGPATADAAIVHHTLAAVTPPANEILHEKVVGVQNGVQVEAEWWQETSPPYANRVIKGAAGHEGEVSDTGTTTFEYGPGNNTITERRDTSPPTPIDPVTQIRQELASGQAQVAGTLVIGGSSLYKIDLAGGLIAYVDPSTYRPLYLDDPQRDGSVVRLRVAALDYLPMTPSNRALLSVTAEHPTVHVDTNPSDAPIK
jgi:hypothetical protein